MWEMGSVSHYICEFRKKFIKNVENFWYLPVFWEISEKIYKY